MCKKSFRALEVEDLLQFNNNEKAHNYLLAIRAWFLPDIFAKQNKTVVLIKERNKNK